MASSCKYYVLLSLVPMVLAAAESDTVNERIPVSRADLELHWRVDCRASWARLGVAAVQALEDKRCDISPDLRREVELCAFIHQPPGEISDHSCPDYRAALGLLGPKGLEQRCGEVADFLAGRGSCPEPAARE